MSSIDLTTASAVRETVLEQVKRIVPRHPERRKRWRHVTDLARTKVTGRELREFQVICAPEVEVPGGAYSGGIEYKTTTVFRVGYPLTEQDVDRFAGADQQDLTAMLVRVHSQLPGMFPVAVEGREQNLITITDRKADEHGFVVDFTVVPGLHFFASDQVELAPE